MDAKPYLLATSVATNIFRSPIVNLLREANLFDWVNCPWRGIAPNPRLRNRRETLFNKKREGGREI